MEGIVVQGPPDSTRSLHSSPKGCLSSIFAVISCGALAGCSWVELWLFGGRARSCDEFGSGLWPKYGGARETAPSALESYSTPKRKPTQKGWGTVVARGCWAQGPRFIFPHHRGAAATC